MADEELRKYFGEMVEEQGIEDLGEYTPLDLSRKLRAYLLTRTTLYCNAKKCLEITEEILEEKGIHSLPATQ